MSEDIKKPLSKEAAKRAMNKPVGKLVEKKGGEFAASIARKLKITAALRAAKLGKKLLSAVPVVGMALSALSLSSGDASASLPLGGVDSTGLEEGQEGFERETPKQGKVLTKLDRAMINKKFKERNK